MRKMLFSLPGMTRELRTTVSPAAMRACLWLLTAARLRAHMGSPWVPLMRIMTCSGGVVADLAGMDDERGGQVEVAEVLGNLRGFEHGAADDGDFAAMLAGELQAMRMR